MMLKRLSPLLLALTLVFLCAVPAFAANTMQEGGMYVNTANGKALRFRSSKSTSADNVLTEIPYGTKVWVLDWDGTWARIRYNSAVGYVVKKYLSIARPEDYSVVQAEKAAEAAAKEAENELKAENKKLDQSKLKTVEAYDVTVRTGVVGLEANLYKTASLLADVLTTYEEGTRLEVTAANNDWAKIYHGGTERTGYMLLEDLEPDIMEDELLEDDD